MKNVRLSKFVKPQRYRLMIKPDLEGFTFYGEETIFLVLEKTTKEITLHSNELKILSGDFTPTTSSRFAGHPSLKRRGRLQTAKISYNKKSETATFTFSKALPKGKGQLNLTFKGILNANMRGFYRSSYMHNGKQKHMATTQFEATDARSAFPCFDEPAHKAVFDVTLMVPKGLTAISNTIETSVAEHESGYQIVKFAPTPKMSTYLLAFIVGDFESIEGKTKDGVLVRVFVTPGKKNQARFALDTAIRCLEFYNKYFDIPYPLPVLDLIAIPDFSHGAMENWGAVTYRESAMLVDPEHSSASNKQWVALVIAHELAHQWFGNLVTMEWWTHLWLNEGFASYIEYLAVDHIFPKWDIWTQFAYADLGVALKLDALKNTHPIEIEVNHPNEISEIFDEVSYSKGASVIRMLAAYLGEKNFRNGLRYYLKKHSYKNASTVHLWEALEKISKKPVREIMRNWTGKPGYPVIRVIEEKNNLLLKQTRFFSSPISKKESSDKTIWKVPLAIGESENRRIGNYLFGQKLVKIKKPKGIWVKLNQGETGFYRVDYPSQMLAALHAPIKEKKLSAIDRLGIVRDAFALAEAGELPTAQALALLEAYKNETDYTVWVEISRCLSNVKNIVYRQKFYPSFERYCLEIFSSIAKKVGFKAKPGEGHTTSLLRSLILQQMVGYNHKPTIQKAAKIYNRRKSISADLRSVIYQAVAQRGTNAQHQQFIKKYQKETLSEEKNRIGRALGQFLDPKLIKKTLDFAFSEKVRIQDSPGIFMSAWNNFNGAQLTWKFIKQNWGQLLKRYPGSGHMLNRFIKPAGYFVSIKDAQDVSTFFKKRPAPGAERTVTQILEKIYSNAEWLKRDGKHIENWL